MHTYSLIETCCKEVELLKLCTRAEMEIFSPVIVYKPQLANTCLLKADIASIIVYERTTVEGNILFDEGSQISFISQDLAHKLNIQLQARKNVSLTSLGAKVPSYRSLDVVKVSNYNIA